MNTDRPLNIQILMLMLPKDFAEYRPQTDEEMESYGRAAEARREYREWCGEHGLAPELPESLERYEARDAD